MTIGILGGGVWGSALARVLSNNKVIIYARDEKIVKSINEHKIVRIGKLKIKAVMMILVFQRRLVKLFISGLIIFCLDSN